jgi:ABC-2 type transport system permease protein
MWNTFKYTILSFSREKSILIWTLIFPLILSTLFSAMFSNIENAYVFEPIPTAIVTDGNYQSTSTFKQIVDSLGESGSGQMLEVTYVSSVQEAESLLQDGTVIGYVTVDTEGTPSLYLPQTVSSQSTVSTDRTILKNLLDNYLRSKSTIETIATQNPLVLSDPGFIDQFFSDATYTQTISITANKSSQSVRYFYALLGFTALMSANIALKAIVRTQANLSALGARRAVGATSRTRTLTASLAASWVLAYACILIGFCYIRFVLGIDFGDRDIACIAGLGISSLLATALGALIGAIPKLPEGAKGGILTGLTCLLSLFAGLYGTSSIELADTLSRTAPLLQALNPAKQISDLFYSLYVYDSYAPFFQVAGTLLIVTVLYSIGAAILMRRQRYASL